MSLMTTIDEIRDNFELLEEWDDRYRYVIELGRTLEPMSEAEHSAANKVQGCASQVWLSLKAGRGADSHPVLTYVGDSDAHIVRGLIAILLTLFSGRKPQDILDTDAIAVFDDLGFREDLTPQRSNGLARWLSDSQGRARSAGCRSLRLFSPFEFRARGNVGRANDERSDLFGAALEPFTVSLKQ